MQGSKFVVVGLGHEDGLLQEWIMVEMVVGVGMDGGEGLYLMEVQVGAE